MALEHDDRADAAGPINESEPAGVIFFSLHQLGKNLALLRGSGRNC